MNAQLALWIVSILALRDLADGQRTQLEQLLRQLAWPADDPAHITADQFRSQFLALVEGTSLVSLAQDLGLDPMVP